MSNSVVGSTNFHMVCEGVWISCFDRLLPCDMFVLGFCNFDVLLGMDMLSRCYAIWDCDKRTMVPKNGMEVYILSCEEPGSRMSSFHYSLDVANRDLESISIFRGFSDVFEVVSSLPPHREIKFRIDLVPNAKPIVLPIHRTSPKEKL